MTDILKYAAQQVVEGPSELFTGRVTIRGQFARDELRQQSYGLMNPALRP